MQHQPVSKRHPTEYRVISPDVLAEFRERGDQPSFWTEQWQETDYAQFLRPYENGYLGEFARFFVKHLPKNARIVEAGCGRGQYVAALRRLGYDILGVDFARELVEAIQRAKPEMPVEVGDVRHLQFANGSLGGYISLGVIEHFWDESDLILAEAHRVLAPGGLLLVSVPHFSPQLRKWATRHAQKYRDESAEKSSAFYQFYFSEEEFIRRIRAARFEPIDTLYYAARHGALRAFPFFNWLYRSSHPLRFACKLLLERNIPQKVQAQFAHMLMVAARKA